MCKGFASKIYYKHTYIYWKMPIFGKKHKDVEMVIYY